MDTLHDTRRDDPDHARMPTLAVENHAEVGGWVVLVSKHFQGLRQRALVLVLSVSVRRIELLSELLRLILVLGEKKTKRIRGLPNAACSVDSRCHHEA